MIARRSRVTRPALVTMAAALLGVVAAALALEGDLPRFGPDGGRMAIGVAIAAALGGAQGAAWSRLLGAPDRPRSSASMRARAALIAAIVAGAFTALAGAVVSPWAALGPFGAGPAGELAFFVLPVGQSLAVLALMGAPNAGAARDARDAEARGAT